MTDPCVHVALPVRGVGPWLDEALSSLLQQSHSHWTARIVLDSDPGTDPQTEEVARKWEGNETRIEVLQPGAIGLVRALNLAVLGNEDAPLVARFDGDDVCVPHRFASQVDFLNERPDIDILDSRSIHFRDGEGAELPGGMARYQRWHDGIEDHSDFEREFLVENPVCHPAVMLRRRVLGTALTTSGGPYREGDFPEDYDLWLRLLRSGARFHKLKEPLIRWRDRDDRTSRTDPSYRKEGFFQVKWEYFAATILPQKPTTVVWGSRGEGKRWTRALVQAGQPPAAVIDVDPRLVGASRQGIPIVEPSQLDDINPQLVLIAVGAPGARALIEARLTELGIKGLAVAGLAG